MSRIATSAVGGVDGRNTGVDTMLHVLYLVGDDGDGMQVSVEMLY